MLASIGSGAVVGLSGVLVDVEVDVSSAGLPSFTLVGLPDKAVEESKERVRSAIKNTGASFPATRITVNLAPADVPKVGPAYDLPIAVGILVASGQISQVPNSSLFFGELSLNGDVRHTNGVLSLSYLAKKQGYKRVFVSKIDAKEASLVSGIDVYPVESLLDLVRHFSGSQIIKVLKSIDVSSLLRSTGADFDFSEIIGQEHAKRAMEIAAAGAHNVYMKGAPGSGKTMLSRALPGILPKLIPEEALEVTKIYSITGNLPEGESLITTRPFRSPHHTTSRVGLIGGGTTPMPGEVSLAHRGVLFLDEFPEFPRNVVESLRQPIEDGVVNISRAKGAVKYPANFMLVAASNPCPCGYYGDEKRECKCLPGSISRYEKRISGPILDRIDVHLEIMSLETKKLIDNRNQNVDSSSDIQKRVQKARDIQTDRFKDTGMRSNSEMTTRSVKNYCALGNESSNLLAAATTRMNLSARSYFKVVKIARTIADLDGVSKISTSHIAEALQYRPRISE